VSFVDYERFGYTSTRTFTVLTLGAVTAL